ncbi:hypothetical protein KL918_003119 [Ogataea parapolymorpha]|uniref:Ras GTPase-activating-like protein rng2 n=1 Tax=Ogataea parapolymorpha (strain ATCC 26012 / BCRC 20466 / JCM 22074 / NRRL Y-7560 / DL-1) TaxID=871575 RepID=W1QA77_OGAPD|nr:Ras GTPase-activating-like protein rng2 [Ogataea parapolymorpha DL-1]ESW97740.1 Ras GTPase-activating-like protein rng2 [Ogataea parapolymorpha DL-1]KAG7866924.1 hypothetical protein KL918_003119 [Ogataea parapolymorpha]KAG7871254.1 hypothetical protein KL916_004253 [Ogataea parapolymorpha]
MSMNTSVRKDGKKNLASQYLEAISMPHLSPLKPTNSYSTSTPSSPTKRGIANLKENENPFKSPQKSTFLENDSPVKRLIKQKEQDTIENNASNFIPIPAPFNSNKLRSEPLHKPTKSEIRTMGQISSAISNSPSLKNLNKLRTIENKLRKTSRVESVSKKFQPTSVGADLPSQIEEEPIKSGSWMDHDRKSLQAYEFLCRVAEIKIWIEECLDVKIDLQNDSIAEFQEYLRNGILVAKLAQKFGYSKVKNIYYGENNASGTNYKNKSGLYFKFTENIVVFLEFLRSIQLPEMFIFETADLFETKNIPKVIFCLHALSYMMSATKKAPQLRRLDKYDIKDSDIKKIQIKIRGLKLPNFKNIDDGVRVNLGDSLITTKESEEENKIQLETKVDTTSMNDAKFIDTTSVIEETAQARHLFKEKHTQDDFDVDIDEIHAKYTSMIDQDNGLSLKPAAEESYVAQLIQLQAIARGTLLRYELFINRFMLKVFTPDIIRFQSFIRGSLARSQKTTTHLSLMANSRSLSVLQAILKNAKREDKYSATRSKLLQNESSIVQLQSLIRGGFIREKKYADRKALLKQTSAIIRLQACIRGNLIREHKSYLEHRLAHGTRKAPRRGIPISVSCEEHLSIHYLEKDYRLTELQAICRGKVVRDDIAHKRKQLYKQASAVKQLQTIFRGVLQRFYIEILQDDLQDAEDSIIGLQSDIRGYLQRKRIRDREEWFRKPENLEKIIKLQNWFRAARTKHDYKSLIYEKNPPLKAIKNFINLLDGPGSELEDEKKIQKYKDEIAKETRRIEQWELDLSQLGAKIQLLKKNNVSLDELLKFKDENMNLTGYSNNLNESLSKSLGANPDQLLIKPIRTLTRLYEKFFYLLQTKPCYLGHLLTLVDNETISLDLSSGSIEDWILKCFNFSNFSAPASNAPKREEFLLMQLILFASNEYFEQLGSVARLKNYMKSRQTVSNRSANSWESLLVTYVNLPQQRALAKSILADCVWKVTSDEDASYEPDPAAIYRDIIERDELEGRMTLKSMDDLDNMDPIDDDDTRKQFVKNLTQLREASYDVMKTIGNLVEKVPVFIRVICRGVYCQMKKLYPGESERFYLSAAGSIFMKSYVLPILVTPENYGINIEHIVDDESHVSRVRDNLLQVAKVLNQLVLMRPFNTENVYLQPLNPFVEEFVEGVRKILKDLIDVGTIEEAYQMKSAYDDVVSNQKPKLELLKDDISELLQIVFDHQDVLVTQKNDYLHFLLMEIEEYSSYHNKIETRNSLVEMYLQPIAESTDPEVVGTKVALLEVKEYLIYIIKVQDGADLLDLLLSEITPLDELRFKEIIKEEKANSALPEFGMERRTVRKIHNSTFPQLKKRAIELLLELENNGYISREDGYQAILNEIAHDIKMNKSKKEERERQLKLVIDTLTKLKKKERTCSKVYSDYIKEIDRVMMRMQHQSVHKKKGPLLKYFSRQYYHEKELKKKKGYVPKFGSYKHSAKHLMDHHILIEFCNTTLTSFALSRIHFTISCERQGEFTFDISKNSLGVSGHERITMDDFLNLQYEHKKTVKLFDDSVLFDTDNLVAFIFKKFYEVNESV